MGILGAIHARYRQCEEEFLKLPAVDDDPARMGTVKNLVFIAQFELDLAAEGESTLTKAELAKIRRFVKKWS